MDVICLQPIIGAQCEVCDNGAAMEHATDYAQPNCYGSCTTVLLWSMLQTMHNQTVMDHVQLCCYGACYRPCTTKLLWIMYNCAAMDSA